MREGGGLIALLAVALAAALLPVAAFAANPPRATQPAVGRYVPYRPPLATVDHPPVDGLNSVDNGSRSDNRVALTFDADMTQGMLQQLKGGAVRSWYNRDVRDVLDAERVPATIFLTGLWANTYPEEARSLAADPLFEIGNHSYDHPAFRTPCYGLAGAGDRLGQVTSAQAAIQTVTGITPKLFRFPGDCYNQGDVAMAGGLGLTVVSGDVRGGDAFNPSAVSVATTVLTHLRPGSIVILHLHGGANAPMTAMALRTIIPAARARGFEFTTVSSLLGREAAHAPGGPRSALDSARRLALERRVTGDQVLAPMRAQRHLEAPRRLVLLSRVRGYQLIP